MRKKQIDHIHKYKRVKLGKFVVYKCDLINCSHFIRSELVEGRLSICWTCGEPFPMTKASTKLVRPHCVSCKKTADKGKIATIQEFLGLVEKAEEIS